MDEATNSLIAETEKHFVDNVLNVILKTFSASDIEQKSSYDVSSMRTLSINKVQKVGSVKLPRADNFFFPQDLYINSDTYKAIPLEYFHMLMPSFPTSHFFNGYLYTAIKLANVDVSFEKSNIFFSATRAIRELIEQNKNYTNPKHLCFMYYTNVLNEDYAHTLEIGTIDSVKFDLWLQFPVHADIEKKYINSVQHKLRYPETKGNLVIKVSCVYDLTYEEIMI